MSGRYHTKSDLSNETGWMLIYRNELVKIAAAGELFPVFRVIEERVCSNGEQSEADESECHCRTEFRSLQHQLQCACSRLTTVHAMFALQFERGISPALPRV